MDDMQNAMPLCWRRGIRHPESSEASAIGGHLPLPPQIGGSWIQSGIDDRHHRENVESGLLTKQRAKLEKDWNIVSKVLPDAVYEVYVYHWLIVNTRSFYYDMPTVLKPKTRDDHMALCPFIDLFNHADEGVWHPRAQSQLHINPISVLSRLEIGVIQSLVVKIIVNYILPSTPRPAHCGYRNWRGAIHIIWEP